MILGGPAELRSLADSREDGDNPEGMKHDSSGIQKRVVFLALAPTLIIAVALAGYFLFVRYADVEAELQNRGQSIIRQLAPTAEYGALSGNRAELLRLVKAVVREPEVVAVSIYDAAGQLLVSAGNPGQLTDPSISPAGRTGYQANRSIEVFRANIYRPSLPSNGQLRADGSRQPSGGGSIGSIVLELSRANLESRKHEIRVVTLLATVSVLMAALLLARRLGRDIVEPVLALERAVTRVRTGALDVRVAAHPSGTLQSLENGFNEMAAALDVSHRQSAQALADSRAELAEQLTFAQTLLDAQSNAGIGLMIVERGKIVFLNRAVENTFGYGASEFVALPNFLSAIEPNDRMRVMRSHLNQLGGKNHDNHYDVAIRRKSGELGHVNMTLASLATGRRKQVLCMFVDITERKEAEIRLTEVHQELLIKIEEVERANKDKSRFLAAASHDLRQPLHALTLFATELAAGMTKPRNVRLAAQIVTAAGAMSELLDALLDVSRLDVAAFQPQRRPAALGPILEFVATAHRHSAMAKGLRLRCRPTELWIDSDPHLLTRMIGNLVANAVRYTSRGGVLIAARQRDDRVRIEVWDTGIGIDSGELPFLFHEFYQVGNQERDPGKGLGLGLSIVARLGQILNHPVNVRSALGRGSVFTITLPIAAPTAALLGEPPSGRPFRPRIAIRTVDIGHCGDISGLLDSWGYGRECICSDAELPRALESQPAMLICDAALLDTIAESLAGLSRRPLLVVLGKEEDLTTLPGLHIDGRLSSPPRPARLRALLHHLLEENSGAEESGTPENQARP
jgi:PAS domain S-box-containing protein